MIRKSNYLKLKGTKIQKEFYNFVGWYRNYQQFLQRRWVLFIG